MELEARRRLQAAKTATAVRRMPPTVQQVRELAAFSEHPQPKDHVTSYGSYVDVCQEPGGVTWPTGEPPQASRPDWGHSIISITARRVR